jgi:L-gulonate 5-dehydrogenase
MIAQTFPSREAPAAFDLVETRLQDTIKVQLAFGD